MNELGSILRAAGIGFAAAIFFLFCSIETKATTLEAVNAEDDNSVQVIVGQDADGNTTVTYDGHIFTRKYNGWYIPSAYIYDGTDLDNFLDAKVVYTRRTSVRYDGFLFVKMSGGWYRHELHINDGRALANVFNQAANITSTYNPNQINGLPEEPPRGQPEAAQ